MTLSQEKTDLWVSVSMRSLFDINSSTQTFAIDAYFNCLYIDPKVKANAEGKFFKGKYIDPDRAKEDLDWDTFPVFHFINNSEKAEETDEIITVYSEPSEGFVNVQRRFILHFDFVAEVHAFPFDQQKLRAKLLFNPCYRLHLSEHMPTAAFAGTVKSQEWSIETDSDGRPHISQAFNVIKGASGIEYTQYSIELAAHRKPGQYIWSYVLPISVLTLLGLPTFLLPVEDLGDRMSGVITLLLTMSAIKIVVNSSTPAVNYLTSLDKFLILTFVLVALAGMESALIIEIAEGEEQMRAQIDTFSFRGYWIAWILIHLGCVVDVIRSRHAAIKKDASNEGDSQPLPELKNFDSACPI